MNKKLKIGINCRVLTERKGGPYRYTLNLIKGLSQIDQKNEYVIILNEEYKFEFELPDNFSVFILKSKIKLYYEYILLPLFSWKKKIDCYIFPKNTFSPMIRGKKIPVFHDIVYFEKNLNFREFKFFDELHHKLMIPVASRFSTFNLTVSDFTANRMHELLGIKEDKIRIAKEGVEESFRIIKEENKSEEVIKKFNIKPPFLFYSGSLSPRKNMVRTLEAFARIKDEIRHNIYFTASYSWRDKEVEDVIEKYNIHDRVIKLGYLTEEELVAMYNLADCYLYPSLYEGFGLPILEAQACGCPVITSNVASCPEVAGKGAVIIDPYDIEEISDAIYNIVSNRTLRDEVIKDGFLNFKKYSWEKCAQEVLYNIENIYSV